MLNNYSAILGCVGLKCWYTIAFVVVFGRTCATMIDPVCALCGFSHGFFPPRGWSGHHLGALQLRLGATQLAHGLVEPQEDLLLPLGSNGLWGGWIGEELFVEVRNWVVVPNIYIIYIYIYRLSVYFAPLRTWMYLRWATQVSNV